MTQTFMFLLSINGIDSCSRFHLSGRENQDQAYDSTPLRGLSGRLL